MSDRVDFHTGYYCKVNKEHWNIEEFLKKALNPQFIDNEDETADAQNIYYDASIFIKGSCHLFSLALHKEFGYDTFEIRKGASCHFFCQTTYQGKSIYIDVRGATTGWEEFLSGVLGDFHDQAEITHQDIEEIAKLNDPDDLYAEDGLAFAKYLIHEHPEYYDIGSSQWMHSDNG